jgi:hypothetical protein
VADLAVAQLAARRLYLAGMLVVTLVPLVFVVLLAPAAGAKPSSALIWVLFVGSSVHVGSTAWFYSVREVRAHMRRHRGRYVVAPVALVVGGAAVAPLLTTGQLTWVLLGFFAWQFFHFQKQNLGVAALAARARRTSGLTVVERRALVATGVGGIVGLLGHPDLLQISGAHQLDAAFVIGAAIFAGGAVTGAVAMGRRHSREPVFTCVYVLSLLFFLPVWVFASPYAAVAGLTIAHGLQYLLLMGLLAAAPTTERPVGLSLLILINVALLLGLALNQMSHLHGHPGIAQALFGVYLGLSMAHFVIDAGLWRLRDEFPRAFLSQRLPFLLAATSPHTPP